MAQLFELAWMGGVAEHHYRRVRPEVEIDWSELDPADHRPVAVTCAQQVWTQLALSEYAAVASFSQVVRAMVEAQAPLDLIGMTSDFLADEVKHVELASRVVMQLGGASAIHFDPRQLCLTTSGTLTPFQRANELALRIGCIAEAFASETAAPIMRASTHPVVRAVYATILRDEARHRRFGSLYFDWASCAGDDLWHDQERERLAAIALQSLGSYAARTPSADSERAVHDHEALALGWFEPARYRPLVQHVITADILPELTALGLPMDVAAVHALLA